ncbi:mechanosensitive ion channel family protein [bacterium]|nr:mechanosensitive ion channel family protein [bacterium]
MPGRELAGRYRDKLVSKLEERREAYSRKNLIQKGLWTLGYAALLSLFLFVCSRLFPFLRRTVDRLGRWNRLHVRYRNRDLIRASSVAAVLRILLKGVWFVLVLFAVTLFISRTLQIWPYTRRWDMQPVIAKLAWLIFDTVVFSALYRGVHVLSRWLNRQFRKWKGTKIRSIRIKTVEVLSADRTVEALTFMNKVGRFALMVFIAYLYLTVVFSLFSFSETWAEKLIGYVLTPLKTAVNAVVGFLPNLFFIIVMVFVFHAIIRFVRMIFNELHSGRIDIPGFYRDWALPTFKIVRFLIMVLAAIIIFPYLPGSHSPFFRGISVFLGVLFSLGSTSAVSNVVAGIVLTYMRPFVLGDRVRIADTEGDVVEKTLLVTRVRTVKNVDITIPNAMVLGSHIVNYSSSAQEKGLILHTTVTIGYDVPWKRVHELLLAAAGETENILDDPPPFVLQKSLDDFHVSYELNAYTHDSCGMSGIYSGLHSKIQDKFNQAGVEIMSPHYGAVRDGNQTTVPAEYLPKEYRAPSFRLFGVNLFGPKKEERP